MSEKTKIPSNENIVKSMTACLIESNCSKCAFNNMANCTEALGCSMLLLLGKETIENTKNAVAKGQEIAVKKYAKAR